VLGSPISHSLSPLLHKSAYEKLGLVGSYEAIELNEVSSLEFLQPIMDRPQESDWGGFSLTMPLKEVVFSDALRSKVRIDATAAHFRTTNTLVNEGTDFFATSTDMTAFVRLLKPHQKTKVLLIGAGGTARAALGALDGIADRIDVAARRREQSEEVGKLALHSDLRSIDVTVSSHTYDVIINTLPAQAQEATLELVQSCTTELYFEVLYKPSPSLALAAARDRGLTVFDGIDLLVEQALDQISLFTKKSFDYDELRLYLLNVARAACG